VAPRGVTGQGSQDLPTTTHFAQIAGGVTEDMVAGRLACGPDPERHIAAIQAYANAGYDEVHIAQIGPDQAGMIRFYEREILPHFR
jgi:hypothetical protein